MKQEPVSRGAGIPALQGGEEVNRLQCPVDGYLVRTTKRHLEAGLPYCPHLHQMVITDPNWEG